MIRICSLVIFSLIVASFVAPLPMSYGQTTEAKLHAKKDPNDSSHRAPPQTVWQQGAPPPQSDAIGTLFPAMPPTAASNTVSTLPKPY